MAHADNPATRENLTALADHNYHSPITSAFLMADDSEALLSQAQNWHYAGIGKANESLNSIGTSAPQDDENSGLVADELANDPVSQGDSNNNYLENLNDSPGRHDKNLKTERSPPSETHDSDEEPSYMNIKPQESAMDDQSYFTIKVKGVSQKGRLNPSGVVVKQEEGGFLLTYPEHNHDNDNEANDDDDDDDENEDDDDGDDNDSQNNDSDAASDAGDGTGQGSSLLIILLVQDFT